MSGLSNARIEPTLHQVYAAHRVMEKLGARMILADEVGLGKTIEAGLILKELRARQMIDRVLIVVPASLQVQWQQELSSKFNEDFQIINGEYARFLGQGGTNPWLRHDNVIASLPLVTRQEYADSITAAPWDLVIFDEAHRVRRKRSGSRVQNTKAYLLADELKEVTSGLLMLTATPMQLDPFELYSLIELVEPGLFPSFASYDNRRKDLPKLNSLMKDLKSWLALTEHERRSVIEKHLSLIEEIGLPGEPLVRSSDPADLRHAMDSVVNHHPLSNVLIRNRKAEVGGFMDRDPNRIVVELTDEEKELYDDVTEYIKWGYNEAQTEKKMAVGFLMVLYQKMLASSSNAIRESFKRRILKLEDQLAETLEGGAGLEALDESTSNLEEMRDAVEISMSLEELEHLAASREAIEWEIGELTDLVERLGAQRDSKAAELLKAMDAVFGFDPDEKVLIFTQFIETQRFLASALIRNGYDVQIFNGQMSVEQKEEAVRRFRSGSQVLITTEAGGEGRNFQFCHFMVNYDLPWNPMRVEQRIGRLDRIGQKHTVRIYNMACQSTVEERVLDVLENRIGLFEESVGSLDPILGQVEYDIERLVLAQLQGDEEAFEDYGIHIERQVRQAREKERVLADFVLDEASLRRDIANDLLNKPTLAEPSDLRSHVASSLSYFGGTLTDHSEGGHEIALSPRLASKLKTRDPVARGVFDPRQALELENLDFFAFGHELIDRILLLTNTDQSARTTARRINSGAPGVWLEVVYEMRSEGVKPSGLMMRHLVGEDLSVEEHQIRELPEVGMPASNLNLPDWLVDALASSKRSISERHDEERSRVLVENEHLKEEQLIRAQRVFDYREERLKALVESDAAKIRELEESADGSAKRIIPALKGKMRKNQDRLERLEVDFEEQVDQIRNRKAGVQLEVVAVGLVVGDA